jgi:hypothetical protein
MSTTSPSCFYRCEDVAVTVDDSPPPVLAPIDLGRTQRHASVLAVNGVRIVLEFDREREIPAQDRGHVFGAPAIERWVFEAAVTSSLTASKPT